MIRMRRWIRDKSGKGNLYYSCSSLQEYIELMRYVYQVRPLIASRFGQREILVLYLKYIKKLGRKEIRLRTGISERKIRKIIREALDFCNYNPW